MPTTPADEERKDARTLAKIKRLIQKCERLQREEALLTLGSDRTPAEDAEFKKLTRRHTRRGSCQ